MKGMALPEAQCEQLRLTNEEQVVIVVEEEMPEVDKIKEHRSVIGRIGMDKTLGREVVRATMGKVWRISKRPIFTTVGKNTFIITSDMEADKYRVLEGRSCFLIALFLFLNLWT